MKKAVQISTTFFLLCVAALPFIFSVYFQISESIVHHQMREELEKNNLVSVQVSSSAFTWTRTGKEAIVNGKMFDVEKFTFAKGEFHLVGLFDKDEDALMAQLESQEENSSDANGSALVLKWFSCFSWIQHIETNNSFLPEKSWDIAMRQINRITNPVLSCDTPPPEPAYI